MNGQQGGGGHFYVTVSTSTVAQARGCIPGWTISGSCYKQLMSRTTNKKVEKIDISFLTEFAGLADSNRVLYRLIGLPFDPAGKRRAGAPRFCEIEIRKSLDVEQSRR